MFRNFITWSVILVLLCSGFTKRESLKIYNLRCENLSKSSWHQYKRTPFQLENQE